MGALQGNATPAPDQDQQRGGHPPSPHQGADDHKLTPANPNTVGAVKSWLQRQAEAGKGRGMVGPNGLRPYLLVRAFAGDTGARIPPLSVFWESPDILVVPGVVDTPAGLTPTLNPQVGAPHTIFVRVWNLGQLAAVGVHLRVYWANPSFSFDPGTPEAPHFIGGRFVGLPDRHDPNCHQLFRIPETWTPVEENGGHECLLAKVDCFADTTGLKFDAYVDRHVGQRNLFLAPASMDLAPLLTRLSSVLPAGASLELLHSIADARPILLAHQPERAETVPIRAELTAAAGPIAGTQLSHLGAAVAMNTAPRFIPGTLLTATASTRPVTGVSILDHPQVQPLQTPADPAGELVRRLGITNLRASTIAAALSPVTGLTHLLRFQAVQNGQVIGGYSVMLGS